MLDIEKPHPVTLMGKFCGNVYAVMSDAATIRAWIADNPAWSIRSIPYDTREDAERACIRLTVPMNCAAPSCAGRAVAPTDYCRIHQP